MRVEIDENSGFCTGVVNAICKAEEELKKGCLYCIGDIVHNSREVERLQQKGLKTIGHEEFAELKNCRGVVPGSRGTSGFLYTGQGKTLLK